MRRALALLALAPAVTTAFSSLHVARPAVSKSWQVHRLATPFPVLTENPPVDEGAALKSVFLGYQLSGAATCAAWAACSWVSLARVPFGTMPTLHNGLCVASALAPLPLIWSFFAATAHGAIKGWKQLSLLTYRRLNLALATASIASLLALFYAPAATNGIVSYGRGPLLWVLAAAYSSAASLTVAAFARTNKPGAWTLNPLALIASGVDVGVDLLANILPTPTLTPLQGGANKYAVLSVGFGLLTALQLGSFPLATVPSFLGARLARGYAAWTLLAAVACHGLHDAADRGRLIGTTYRYLKRGLERFAGYHLLLVLVKAVVDSPARYPAALQCPAWSLASIAIFALVLRPDVDRPAA